MNQHRSATRGLSPSLPSRQLDVVLFWRIFFSPFPSRPPLSGAVMLWQSTSCRVLAHSAETGMPVKKEVAKRQEQIPRDSELRTHSFFVAPSASGKAQSHAGHVHVTLNLCCTCTVLWLSGSWQGSSDYIVTWCGMLWTSVSTKSSQKLIFKWEMVTSKRGHDPTPKP